MLEAARAALGARRLVRVCTHCTAVCSAMSDVSRWYHEVKVAASRSATADPRGPVYCRSRGPQGCCAALHPLQTVDLLRRVRCLDSSRH